MKVTVSGHWFDNMPKVDRKKNYEAVAVEYMKERNFPGSGRNALAKHEAIRFHVMEDVMEDGEHLGW